MKTLRVEYIKKDVTMIKQMPFIEQKGFFIALITICDEWGLDVPIWTAREDILMERNKKVLLDLGKSESLIVSLCS